MSLPVLETESVDGKCIMYKIFHEGMWKDAVGPSIKESESDTYECLLYHAANQDCDEFVEIPRSSIHLSLSKVSGFNAKIMFYTIS